MILVTGGTGLLGSHLLMRLIGNGLKVRAIYRTGASRKATLDRLQRYYGVQEARFHSIDWVEGDVLDIPSLEDALNGVSQVYHCAATVSFLPSEIPHMNQVNVEGTCNLANLCLGQKNIRLCHVSSVAAIGRDGARTMINENAEWKDSKYNSAYAISKHRAEMEIWRAMAEGLNAFIINPSVILGPGDWNRSSGALFKQTWRGFPFYTRGGNCFVDVRDVVEVMVQLMDTDIHAERFIIGAENRRFRELLERTAHCFGKTPPRFEASPLLAGATWRIERLVSALTGRRPFITEEIARYGLQTSRYDNSKLLRALADFRYRDIDSTLDSICQHFTDDMAASDRP